jgi:trehalose transport system substrate-binding protein
MRYLMSHPVQEKLVSSLGWPSFRTDVYGAVQAWQVPYVAAAREALQHVLPRPPVPYWAQIDRAVTGAFREIVYDGQPVQPTLDRYHGQIQQAQQRWRR